jgi:hypothetical protein
MTHPTPPNSSGNLQVIARQVLQDMKAQDVLHEWHDLLDEALVSVQPTPPNSAAELPEIKAAQLFDYTKADQDFYAFWYAHMFEDFMQPPLTGISHSVARYIWNAALNRGACTDPAAGVGIAMAGVQPAPQQSAPAGVLGWIHEDELPESYPYSAMYPHSKVDVVRLFPVFGPRAAPSIGADGVDAGEITRIIASFDAIYAAYKPSMGKGKPDDEILQILEATKRRLFAWWGEHRETIRAALAAQKGGA